MQRRNFVKAAALAPALTATELTAATVRGSHPTAQREVYEWREYTFNFNLTYLLAFRDMEERDKNWAAFSSDPAWKALLKDPQYAYTVSKIYKTFLVPTDYSQL